MDGDIWNDVFIYAGVLLVDKKKHLWKKWFISANLNRNTTMKIWERHFWTFLFLWKFNSKIIYLQL